MMKIIVEFGVLLLQIIMQQQCVSPRKPQPIVSLRQLRVEDSGFRLKVSFSEIGLNILLQASLVT